MKKNYIQPMIEIMTVHSMDSICAASGGGKSVNVSTQTFSGEDLFL